MTQAIPFAGLPPWGRCALAALAGSGTAMSLPPFDIIPAIAGYGVLALLLTPARVSRLLAALTAGAFGFGYHLAGLWWVGAAFLVDAQTFGALLPLGVIGLPLGLSLFHAAAGFLTALAPPALLPRAVALAAALTLTELARANILTGFPWNAPGMGLTGWLPFMQTAAYVGLNGLNLAALLAGTLWVCIWGSPRVKLAATLTPAILVALGAVGLWRLAQTSPGSAGGPMIKIVQPNIAQRDKADPALASLNWATLLSTTAIGPPADLVVWPETAIPFIYAGGPARPQLSTALGDSQWLITGAVQPATRNGEQRYTNSVLVIAPDGTIQQRYDKLHLVPFGEFLPLSGILSAVGLKTLVDSASAFVPGKTWQPLNVPGLPALEPLICYEVIFPRPTSATVSAIINVTNDAWFGDTPGPHQHLRHAALRAVVRGLPVVRAANTGLSAVISPEGEVLEQLGLGERGTITAQLPAPSLTIQSRNWSWAVTLLTVIFLVSAVALPRRL